MTTTMLQTTVSSPAYDPEPPAPEYQEVTSTQAPTEGEDAALPDYAPRAIPRRSTNDAVARPLTEHLYHLTNNKTNKPWLTLKILSRSPSAKSLPTIMEDEDLKGEIILDLDKPESIQAISIQVKGEVIRRGTHCDYYPFMTLNEILWDSSKGDPRPSAGTASKFNGKFVGKYTWPISIKLPKTTNVSAKQIKELGLPDHVRLPSTFVEKGCYSVMDYEVTAVIKRPGLRSQSKLGTVFGYTQRTRPEQPSSLCQMAYREGTPLLGPDIDPDGWHVFAPVDIAGSLFNAVNATVKVTCALSKPLAYARGTVIPCMLILESSDTAALDLLANPKVPAVALYRKLNTSVSGQFVTSKPSSKALASHRPLIDDTQTSLAPIKPANWWVPQLAGDVSATTGTKRALRGEILVPADTKPSFEFSDFAVRYEVKMLSLKTAGFVPENDSPPFTTEVQITSMYAAGPRPIAYAKAVQTEVAAETGGVPPDLLRFHWFAI